VSTPSVVAFVPARSGSTRVADKNIRRLAGHPLMAYTIAAARQSGIFGAVVCSTDSETYAEVARYYGAEVPFLRPNDIAGSTSPDIEWVLHTFAQLRALGRQFDCFSILRPTSPFRQAATIRRAWDVFRAAEGAHSLRAVEKVQQHPGKMWVVRGDRMVPLMPLQPEDRPWHSQQVASLPTVYVQNASLEIAWTEMAERTRTIAGTEIVPFFTEGHEGTDINVAHDWWFAEHIIAQGEAALPEVLEAPFASGVGYSV
jgi:CMP-N-acetylneuraminic acid synthetase